MAKSRRVIWAGHGREENAYKIRVGQSDGKIQFGSSVLMLEENNKIDVK
jgi:hypothetical protein